MRSVKHHCLYWLVACAAATIYQVLTLKSGVPAVLFYVLLVPLLPFFVILVVRGPRDEPWPRLYHIATAALLISLGCFCSTFRLSAPDVARPGFDPRPFAHCCLAFQVLGSLESIRQNRLDIDPCNVGLLHGAPDACFSYPKKRTLLRRFLDVIRLRLLYLTVLAPLALALDGLLRRLYASEMSFTSVALGSISVPRHVGNPAMLFYIGAALADVAETVFLLVVGCFDLSWARLAQGPLPMVHACRSWNMCTSGVMCTSLYAMMLLVGMAYVPQLSRA